MSSGCCLVYFLFWLYGRTERSGNISQLSLLSLDFFSLNYQSLPLQEQTVINELNTARVKQNKPFYYEENHGYLYALNGIGSSLNNNKHTEATLFMVAKASLCKIKLVFKKKKKKQWVKNDLSVSSPL